MHTANFVLVRNNEGSHTGPLRTIKPQLGTLTAKKNATSINGKYIVDSNNEDYTVYINTTYY